MMLPSELDVDEPSLSGFDEWSPPSRAMIAQLVDVTILNEGSDIAGIFTCGL